ncbi:probable leucine-rich repeat receptor-like serine/threonine-protein kinase At3g14840 isoform X3 [Phalaenopsis equestris]|uniref:probable leucine-rich repeat receptor-like serine/threonine-protein kinase At3g14840 isoform X3 n=1 Tax=Phalaenopsis equestris TaxID=78828 RepID=UPI0009E340D0|nr:probable leucine-rich repeat receptor-like serine/threonine-protein kinase At3g14840 isoform X3 [Phalaenopsis equestris]
MVKQSAMFILFLALGFVTQFVLARLPPEEIEALKSIARAINKTNWDFSLDPCSQAPSWVTHNAPRRYENSVWCNKCSNDGSVCHVTSIVLKRQNLVGVIPRELARLPFLQQIDLSVNYIYGSIPRELAVLPLVNFSLNGNRISGQIPSWIGNITTLRNLSLEDNLLMGSLPKQIGNLKSLEMLKLSANFFSGELPDTFANLTNLKYFMIRSNNFNGKIPQFIQNWTQLVRLDLQASGLEGPIPSGISRLKNLDDFRRISDIVGNSGFPQLQGIEQLQYMTLRNCGISGEIPKFMYQFVNLRRLDLSYNKLSGSFSKPFENLEHTNFMFLTSNNLSGPVPNWMLWSKNNIDLSYNNFTLDIQLQTCQVGKVNLLGSSYLLQNMNKPLLCLDAIPCTRKQRSLNINCGGHQVTTGDNLIFESDNYVSEGVSTFYMGTNWAVSSTGGFLDSGDNNNFIARTTQKLSMPDSELYANARVSPLSLSYYGLCLINGNYSVKLHFAEIIITDYNGHSSPGRRLFDVYIQGELVLKDFNIKAEANGSGKAVVKKFDAIVTQNKLEIRFHWAGKGTTNIPTSGTYGPLVSAISVDANFKHPNRSKKLVILLVVILVPVLCLIILLLYAIKKKHYFRLRDLIHRDLKLQTGSFSLSQIKDATNNFSASNKIGEGGFGSVYRGLLSDGTVIAVKQLSSKSTQGNREFLNEMGLITALQHPNLVRLYGCCVEGNQLLLVYEYLENNSLANALFGPEKCQLKLDWSTRHKVCIGIARGLAYLHEESMLSIVHRDIKSANVLLDRELNPKISDFGLAKLNKNEHTHISTGISGTMGYMAPEYVTRGYLTVKADVYSFGIVALEIVTGKSVTKLTESGNLHLLDWAHILKEKGELLLLVDKKLGLDFNKEEALRMIKVALLCSNSSPARRPALSTVVSMLTSDISVTDSVADSAITHEHLTQEIWWNPDGNETSTSQKLIQPLQ